jgi:hypothetical protein
MYLDFRTFAGCGGAAVSAVSFRSGVGVEDEGVVYPLFWRACCRPGRAGQFKFGVLAGAGLVDRDGPVVGGALVAQDRGVVGAAGQEGSEKSDF